ncbi:MULTISPECIES: EAL domain-containing protein [Burkholderia]|uniref:EAL domain-containing protein n=1 Tax=Burkholderia TaxID=32008 RepID=UPI00158ED1EC|nr:EAL domain-containing protein [Burkholderia ambifaria]
MSYCTKAMVQYALARGTGPHGTPDLGTAAMVLAAMACDQVILCAQPIFSVQNREQVLYHECLVRLRVGDDQPITYPSAFIPSLERLGLMRYLDRYVIGMAAEFLESNSNIRLGVNISAQSANEIGGWASVLRLLEGRPDIASRLVVEITETTQLSPVTGRAFVEHLRRIGCCIAVDDFGDGFSIENRSVISSPEIIKISGRMLPTGEHDAIHLEQFKKLVIGARGQASQVVVEGIESADALRTASLAGAQWVQGYYTGKPSRLRMIEQSTGGAVGHSMQQFERIAYAVIEPHMDGKMHGEARRAFAAGLASALYGRRSAIATSMRSYLTDAMEKQAETHNTSSVRLLRCFAMLGRLNGQGLARPLRSGADL